MFYSIVAYFPANDIVTWDCNFVVSPKNNLVAQQIHGFERRGICFQPIFTVNS